MQDEKGSQPQRPGSSAAGLRAISEPSRSLAVNVGRRLSGVSTRANASPSFEERSARGAVEFASDSADGVKVATMEESEGVLRGVTDVTDELEGDVPRVVLLVGWSRETPQLVEVRRNRGNRSNGCDWS